MTVFDTIDSSVPDLPYLQGLNPRQREAVEAIDGAVLVLAGAGTGKTRVLTTRLSHILMQQRARASNILAVTFTNKAAREMRERVERMVGGVVEGMWLGTFHSVCVRMLRRHADLVGLTSSFTILDDDDQIRLIKQVMEAANIDIKRWPPKMVHAVIGRFKDRGLTPDKVTLDMTGDMAGGKLLPLYQEYQQRLKTLNCVDFGDLLLHVVTIFTRHPDILADYQGRFHYILVDEYQDTNLIQYLWLRLLAQGRNNICCVGDDDQSIYSWRGAEVGNILRFEKDFVGAKIIRLEQNYRSTQNILNSASHLIANNSTRLGKTLWTDARDDNDRVHVQGVWDGEEEARFVADQIERHHQHGLPLKHMAILVRAGFQTREFEERLMRQSIPYKVVGGARFYERMEIRDAMAYLRVIAQPNDSMAFERIMNVPKRGLGDAALQALHQAARDKNTSLFEAAWHLVQGDALPARARTPLHGLLNDFTRWTALAQEMSHPELAKVVLDESGYTGMWQKDTAPEAPGRLDNLKELIEAMADFENLAGFLEHVSLVMDTVDDANDNVVSIMTLHGAKGLEFDLVCLAGWEEGIFPSQRTLDEAGTQGLEEERRLAYVGITRAKKHLYITYASHRRVYGNWQDAVASRFIAELPKESVTMQAASGGLVYRAGQTAPAAPSFARSPMSAPSRTAQPAFAAPRSRVIDVSARPPKIAAPTADGFAIGKRVRHAAFGYGVVRSIESDKCMVIFERVGIKKVLKEFIQPA